MAIEKILLVDNISKYRDTVRDFLELYDYQVFTAADLETALALANREKPSLAVIDIRLNDDTDDKDESGLILAKKLGAALPKIMLSAFPDYQAVRESMAALDGPPIAENFVAKQEGLHKLLNVIREVLGKLRPELVNGQANVFQDLAIESGHQQANSLSQVGSKRSNPMKFLTMFKRMKRLWKKQ